MSDFLTASENAKQAVDLDPVRQQRETTAWKAANRMWRAITLAPTLDICQALLQGEHVPLDRLDHEWVRRFGLRQQDAA
jgi:hypothetical protein